MRKDAIIGLFVTMSLLTISVSIDAIFNVVSGFFLSGVIPGTGLALPSIFMFAVAVLAISSLIVRLLRRYLPDSKPVTVHSFKLKSSV